MKDTVTLEGFQIVANKDIYTSVFKTIYITNQVYFYTFLQLQYNIKILFVIYCHSPKSRTAMISACGLCSHGYLMLAKKKALVHIWFWLECSRVGMKRKPIRRR